MPLLLLRTKRPDAFRMHRHSWGVRHFGYRDVSRA